MFSMCYSIELCNFTVGTVIKGYTIDDMTEASVFEGKESRIFYVGL